MVLDALFQIWRRMSGYYLWWFLWLVSSKFMLCVAGVVIDDRGQVLLQRHRHWVKDVWGLPGGIVHRGEVLEKALAREVFEETGLAISDIEFVRLGSGHKLRLEVYYRARLAPAGQPLQIRLQTQEVLEARFFPTNQLPSNIFSLQREVIQQSVVNLQKAGSMVNG